MTDEPDIRDEVKGDVPAASCRPGSSSPWSTTRDRLRRAGELVDELRF